MTILFFTMLGVHTIHSLAFRNRKAENLSPAHRGFVVVNQSLIFLAAIYLAHDAGLINRALWAPWAIALGVVLGHAIFSLSVVVTHWSFAAPKSALSDGWELLCDVPGLFRFLKEHPYVLSKYFYVALSEELIWRGVAQPMAIETLGWAIGIVLIALAFSVVHDHFLRNSTGVSLEFLAFSIAVGGLYYATGSLTIVILVHMLRDVEIAYLEFVVKVHELGDERLAHQSIEESYMPPRLRKSYGH